MSNCIITFRSVMPAQRAETTLRRAGIECALRRTPKWMEERGCGYSLRLDCQSVTAGTLLLHQNGINYGKVYTFGNDGTPEELKL